MINLQVGNYWLAAPGLWSHGKAKKVVWPSTSISLGTAPTSSFLQKEPKLTCLAVLKSYFIRDHFYLQTKAGNASMPVQIWPGFKSRVCLYSLNSTFPRLDASRLMQGVLQDSCVQVHKLTETLGKCTKLWVIMMTSSVPKYINLLTTLCKP